MWVKPRAVVLDESHHWLDFELVEKAGGIFGLYIYDSNVAIHCAEMTSSYMLEGIGPVFGNETGTDTLTDKMVESIDQEWSRSNAEEPISYIHCNEIDKLVSWPLPSVQCKKDEYDEFMKNLAQAYRENWPGFDEVLWRVKLLPGCFKSELIVSGFQKSHVIRRMGDIAHLIESITRLTDKEVKAMRY